jgi:hypothetical protein
LAFIDLEIGYYPTAAIASSSAAILDLHQQLPIYSPSC